MDLRDRTAVALKVPHTATTLSDQVMRREVTFLRRLSHAGLASYFDSGCLPDGRTYLVRELVLGISLEHLLHARRLCLPESLELAERLCAIVAYLHASGFLHRDLKPGNVIIPGDKDNYRFNDAVLIDFGVMRAFDERMTTGVAFTFPKRLAGTAPYMAPEQLLGRPLSAATDLYGLGAILFDVLYGSPPFGNEEIQQAVLGDDMPVIFIGAMVQQRVSTEIAIPSEPTMPTELRELLRQLLRRRSSERPQSAAGVGKLLRELRYSLCGQSNR